jgi:hypothetical protein
MLGTTKQDHQVERLQAIRLRYRINTHLEDRGIITPAAIGAATGLPAAKAVRLLPGGSGARGMSLPSRLSPPALAWRSPCWTSHSPWGGGG